MKLYGGEHRPATGWPDKLPPNKVKKRMRRRERQSAKKHIQEEEEYAYVESACETEEV